MVKELIIGDVTIDVIFKDIKNVHLSVHPPTGRVRMSAPQRTSWSAIRLFALSKLAWIKRHQKKLRQQPRETPREYLERESHYVWGRRYLLRIAERRERPSVAISNRALELTVPPKSPRDLRQHTLTEWYRAELRKKATPIVAKWAARLKVDVKQCYIQRMRTKWGSSNPVRGTIRLNLDLARYSPECLDYVVLHELAHFIVPNHSEKFRALLDRHMPGWKVIREALSEHPLPHNEFFTQAAA